MHKQALDLIRDSLSEILDDPEAEMSEGMRGLLKMYVNIADIALQNDSMFFTGISKDDVRRSTN